MISTTIPIINPLHWGSNGTVTHIKNEKLIDLKTKDGANLKLDEFVHEYVPELDNGAHFKLNPKYFTGYLQGLYLGMGDFSKSFQILYGREIFTYKDGGSASCDYVKNDVWTKKYYPNGKFDKESFKKDEASTHLKDWPRLHPRTRYLNEEEIAENEKESEKPLIIIMHGLCGGSFEPIVRAFAHQVDLSRFQVVVLHTRGCGRTKATTQKLFSAFSTDDLKEIIDDKIAKNPKRHIYAVGFSFGATMLANYLGSSGSNSNLKAAATLCNPWDLYYSYEKMTFDFWSSRLFSKAIVKFLVRTVEVNMPVLEQPEDVEHEAQQQISQHKPSYHVFTRSNIAKAKKFTQTVQFDETFTAPALGYSTAIEYYKDASSMNRLPEVRTPLLAINAEDDPVVGTTHERLVKLVEENPYVLYCSTDLGGHLPFLDKNNDPWATKQIAKFFEKFEVNVE